SSGILPQNSVFWTVLQIRRKIPNRCQSEPSHGRIFRAVNHIVNTGYTPAVQFDGATAFVKLPQLVRQYRRGLIDSGPAGQLGILVIGGGGAIKQWKNNLFLSITVLNVSFAHHTLNLGDRCLKCEAVGSRNVEFPSEIGEAETLINEEFITKVPV